jgi:hypothetical protein
VSSLSTLIEVHLLIVSSDGTLKTIELVLAIMAFVVAGVELAAFVIGCTVSIIMRSPHASGWHRLLLLQNKLRLAKFLVWLAPAGLLVACARELVVVVVHFAMKVCMLRVTRRLLLIIHHSSRNRASSSMTVSLTKLASRHMMYVTSVNFPV